MKTLLVDGDSLLKTAFYGAKNVFYKGSHIGGLYQFFAILRKLLIAEHPNKVVIFWDTPTSSNFKTSLYPFYKSNRLKDYITPTQKDKDLWLQKERVKEYLEEFFIRQFENKNAEADDCIAYYVLNRLIDENIVICSGDYDFCQLIDENVSLYSFHQKKLINKNNYSEIFKYHLDNAGLVKILAGDQSDNVVGIMGVGDKTLIEFFPELKERKLTLEYIVNKAKELNEQRNYKVLENIINGKTKFEDYSGERFFEIIPKLTDLHNPPIDEETKKGILDVVNLPLNPEGRTHKNALRMMMKDGFVKFIPGGVDKYYNYIQPFIILSKQEIKRYEI